jgi:hypothetical protein
VVTLVAVVCKNKRWLSNLLIRTEVYLLDFLSLPMMQKAEAKLSWIRTGTTRSFLLLFKTL